MQVDATITVLGGFFALAFIMGAVINRTNFCTMGAVSDWVNIGDKGRMGAWLLAIATAMLAVALLEFTAIIDVDSTRPAYRSANFAWPRYLAGGAMFGIGMALAGGCVSKNLVRFGAGNVKSLVTLAIAAAFAYLMTKTRFFEIGFHSWIEPTTVDLAQAGIDHQDIGNLFSPIAWNVSPGGIRLLTAAFVVLFVYWFVMRTRGMKGNGDNWFAGIAIGLAVAGGWCLTASAIGEAWEEAAQWADQPPFGVGAQSFTFVNPLGEILALIAAPGNAAVLLTAGIMAAVGLAAGSFVYAALARQLHLSWFASVEDFVANAIGGVLMGIGGVLALGCTVGQGISGLSTLAAGSLIATISVIFSCASTLKIQYYRTIYDDASFLDALISGWVDLKILPESMRKLDSV